MKINKNESQNYYEIILSVADMENMKTGSKMPFQINNDLYVIKRD